MFVIEPVRNFNLQICIEVITLGIPSKVMNMEVVIECWNKTEKFCRLFLYLTVDICIHALVFASTVRNCKQSLIDIG